MICRSCNKQVDDARGYSFCPHCGMALAVATPSSQSWGPASSGQAPRMTPAPSTQQNFPNTQSSLPAPLQPVFVFRTGETLLRLMNTTYIGDSRRQMGSEDIDMPFEGVLIITDQRLSFAMLVGLISKRWSVHKSIELSNVKGTEVRAGYRKNYLGVYMISDRVSYTESWMEFFETDPNTLKRGRAIDLSSVQQVINDAIGRNRSRIG